MNRYDRQIRLEEIGVSGQKKLAKARILCIGAGGLGSPILYYLTGAGIGTLGLVDGDKIDLTNLHRQILYTENEIGLTKAQSAKTRLEKLNSQINIIAINEHLTEENAESLFKEYDLIIDGTDNFITKFLINKTAKKLDKPWIYGSATGFEGQIVFFNSKSSCLKCLLPQVPEQNPFSCAENGVLGALVGWVGSIQALQAIRFFLDPDQYLLDSQLLFIDGWNFIQKKFKIPQLAHCPICHNLQPNRNSSQNSQVNKTSNKAIEKKTLSEEEIIDIKNYFIINLCDDTSLLEIKADHSCSISDLFVLESIPTAWQKDLKPLLFYCESGYKSQIAINYLKELGIKNISHLIGGLNSWQKKSETILVKKEKF